MNSVVLKCKKLLTHLLRHLVTSVSTAQQRDEEKLALATAAAHLTSACITGEADPSSDYEIDEVLKARGR